MSEKIILHKALRVAKFSRILAKVIDIFVVLLLILPFYPLGVFMGLIYLALSDSLQYGQSVGKKTFGFRVVDIESGEPCSVRQSIIRNLPFLIPTFFAIFPFWGWVITFLVGIPLGVLELYFIVSLDSGQRVGDVMADTTVIASSDSKELISKVTANN